MLWSGRKSQDKCHTWIPAVPCLAVWYGRDYLASLRLGLLISQVRVTITVRVVERIRVGHICEWAAKASTDGRHSIVRSPLKKNWWIVHFLVTLTKLLDLSVPMCPNLKFGNNDGHDKNTSPQGCWVIELTPPKSPEHTVQCKTRVSAAVLFLFPMPL
jgi:hypothetical protein